MPLSVYQDKNGWIHFQQDIDKQSASSGTQEGCSLEYFYNASNTGNAAVNNGVFVDRDIYKSSTDTTVIQRGWKIVPIEGDAKKPSEYTLIAVVHQGINLLLNIIITTSLQPLLWLMWIKIVVLS